MENVLKSPITETGYWGNTTPEQDEALIQLREKSKDILTPRYDDVRLLRFLRARQFSVENAFTMLKKDIDWRKENKIDSIIETFPEEPGSKALLDYFPHRTHKMDIYGIPFKVERLGQCDPKGLITTYSTVQLERMHIYQMELVEREIEIASKKAGRPLDYGVIGVEDVADLGWKHMYTPAISIVKNILTIDKDHYPELLRKLLIINCPSIFSLFWKIFKPLIDPRTVAKTEIYSDKGYFKHLEENLDMESIPTLYFGKCPDHGGKCIPGGGDWTLSASDLAAQSLYVGGEPITTQTNVKSRAFHEVPITIENAHTTISFEFKIHAHSIGFKVLRETEKGREEVLPHGEHEGSAPIKREIVAKETGVYILHWDNTSSFMRSKDITYQIQLLPPPVEDLSSPSEASHSESDNKGSDHSTEKHKKSKKSKKDRKKRHSNKSIG